MFAEKVLGIPCDERVGFCLDRACENRRVARRKDFVCTADFGKRGRASNFRRNKEKCRPCGCKARKFQWDVPFRFFNDLQRNNWNEVVSETRGKNGSCRAIGRIESCQECAGINEYAQLFLHSVSARSSRAFLSLLAVWLYRHKEKKCGRYGGTRGMSGFSAVGDLVPVVIFSDKLSLKLGSYCQYKRLKKNVNVPHVRK